MLRNIILLLLFFQAISCAPLSLDEAVNSLNYTKDEMLGFERWSTANMPTFYINNNMLGVELSVRLECIKAVNNYTISMSVDTVRSLHRNVAKSKYDIYWDDLLVKNDESPVAKIHVGEITDTIIVKHRSGKVYSDRQMNALSKNAVKVFVDVVNSQRTTVRLVGDSVYSPDKVLTDTEKYRIHAILLKCGAM